jgi:hypothetical protein
MKDQIVVRRVKFAGAQDSNQSAGEDAHQMADSHFMGFALVAFAMVIST